MQHYSERAFIDRYPLSPKKIWKKMITGGWGLILLILFLGFGLIAVLAEMHKDRKIDMDYLAPRYGYTFLIVITCIFLFLLILNYLYQRAYIKQYYYNITDKLLIIRKGIFAQHEITVPFERIQDVYVDQDLFDVMFGLYDVHISTATATSGTRAHIDGIEKAAAEEIRKLILSKIH